MYEYGGAVTHPAADDVELEILLGLVCDAVLRIAEKGGDWQAELDRAIKNDADESEFLGIEG